MAARRFYKRASVAPAGEAGCYSVTLDGRAVRTPAGAPLAVPARALAELIAAEWEAQGETIAPDTMPVARLANVAIDRVPPARAALIDEIAAYAETDLVAHLAEEPAALAARQEAAWAPLRAWAARDHRLDLTPVAGVIALEQPAQSLRAARALLEARDDFRLAGLAHAVQLTGSLVLGLALAEGRIDAEEAFQISRIDEMFQEERWGVDDEAAEGATRLRAEIAACARFLGACGK